MSNISNETTASFANKLYKLTSTAHGEDYCGKEDSDEDLVNSVKYWVSGVSVTVVGSLGKSFTVYYHNICQVLSRWCMHP